MLLYLHPCTWTVSNSLTSIFLLIITTHWTHSDLASQRWSVWGTLCLGWSVAGVCVWLVQTLSWGMGLIVCWTRLTSHLFARTALRPLYLFFLSLGFSLKVPEDMTEGVWNLSLSVGSPQGWLCLDHAATLVVERLLVSSVVCEVIITQAGHPMASPWATTAWVINEGPFSL